MAKQIKLVKSLIGRKSDQIATAHSLGLKKIGQVVVQPDNCLLYTSCRSHICSS